MYRYAIKYIGVPVIFLSDVFVICNVRLDSMSEASRRTSDIVICVFILPVDRAFAEQKLCVTNLRETMGSAVILVSRFCECT